MSIKRRMEYQYHRMASALQCLALPDWMTSLPFRFSLTALVIVMGVSYVCKTSNLSTSGFVLRDLENQVALLESDIQKTKVEVALNSSISSIENRLKNSDMVSVNNFNFVSPVDSFVAKR